MPKVSRKANKKVKIARMHDEMSKFKRGKLHSGSKKGPIVKNRKQAIAIGLNEAGLSKNDNSNKRQARKVGKLRHGHRAHGKAAKHNRGKDKKKSLYKR